MHYKQFNSVIKKAYFTSVIDWISSIFDDVENNSNNVRIYKLNEMDADHVTAWSNSGKTGIENCKMLCKTHNRAKGNK